MHCLVSAGDILTNTHGNTELLTLLRSRKLAEPLTLPGRQLAFRGCLGMCGNEFSGCHDSALYEPVCARVRVSKQPQNNGSFPHVKKVSALKARSL